MYPCACFNSTCCSITILPDHSCDIHLDLLLIISLSFYYFHHSLHFGIGQCLSVHFINSLVNYQRNLMFSIYFPLYFEQFDFNLNYNIDHGAPYLSWIYIDFSVSYNSDLKHSLKSIFFHIFILDQHSKHWIFIRLISSVAKLESIQTIIV